MKKVMLFILMLALVTIAEGQLLPHFIPYVSGNKWGYCDSNGRVLIKPQWRYVEFFDKGRASVHTDDSHCLIDTNGEYVIPPYRHWSGKFYTSVLGAYFNATGKNGKHGIIDSNNNEILPCLYEPGEPGNGFTRSGFFMWDIRQKKYAAKEKKDGKFGIIDTQNNILIPFEYGGIDIDGYPFSSNKYYVVRQGDKMGLIDAGNRTIIPAKYRNIWLDKEDDNQIMLFKERTTIIVDTNGRTVLEIPGYSLSFPRHSLVTVQDSAGKYGVVNLKGDVIIPCENLSTWIKGDTIVICQMRAEPAKAQAQYFKCYNLHTLKEISGWITYQQLLNLPEPAAAAPLKWDESSKLPWLTQFRVKGKDVREYRIGDILWAASDYPKFPGYLIPVRGIARHDSVAKYAAILDSNGNYVMEPKITDDELRVINAADGLIAVHLKGSPNESVVDFHFKTILPFQPCAVVNAFYYRDTFYAIIKQDMQHTEHWHSFEGGGSYMAHDYTYYLVTADGKLAPGTAQYKLHWFTDSNSYRVKVNGYNYGREDNFDGPFPGYFVAEDNKGKQGIININGQIILPGLSFKYDQLDRIGPGIFLVNNVPPKRDRLYDLGYQDADNRTEAKPPQGLLHGLPYLVNLHNIVLQDSLSIESLQNIAKPGAAPLYLVYTKPAQDAGSYKNVAFYMNDKGIGYYSDLPGDKKKAYEEIKNIR